MARFVKKIGFFIAVSLSAGVTAAQSYEMIKGGVIVRPDPKLSGNAAAVHVQVISDKILRVIASPVKDIVYPNSLSVLPSNNRIDVVTSKTDSTITIATPAVRASISRSTGAVQFRDATGNVLLAERSVTGRQILPVVLEGAALYSLRQTFETSQDDAFYGLGQHQEDAFNYKGRQVIFFQNNTEVAVPFVISPKNYGVLWDNYSYGKAGDIRPYQSLSALQLFDKNNTQGWLTASYANDRNKPNAIAFEKAESDIAYSYVNDSKLKLPKEFAVDKGMITWEGSIGSQVAGIHRLKFVYAGYVKVWIDGQLMADKWRQAWNPGAALLEKELQPGKRHAIRIQWIPDGNESYFTASWQPPSPRGDENTFSFDSEAGKNIDYYFIYGRNMDEVISGYRQLTGKAPIVPKWALGFWQSRERYKTQTEVLDAVAEFRRRKIPLDNIVLDWSYWKQDDWGSQEFEATRFSNPDSMIDVLHKKYKTRFMISVWPKFYEGINAYKQFDQEGWLYKRNIADRQRDWIAQGYISTFYDAFNADARKGFWNLIHDKLYVKGIDAWWMDASEPDILSNVSPERRKQQMSPTALGTAAEYLNAYPLQNAKGIYEGQRGVDPDKRVFLLTRSGFSGSQRYGATIWSGDIASRWEDMRSQITAGTNFSMSGLPYWTMDIGGFSVERRYERPNESDLSEWRELMTRWYQFGSFTPLFRVHGQFPFREIYNTAPEDHPAYRSMLYYNKLRYRLMPYIYSLAGHAYHADYTIMRGLVMDFPNDMTARNTGDQFLFGPALLINPVYSYKASSRTVYLPAGQGWYDLYTGKYHHGGQTITADAPYERVPVFVKEGSILLSGPELQYTDEKPSDPISIHVYTGKDGAFTLYEDENLNYNYEKGSFLEIPFTYNEQTRTLNIGTQKGDFKGALKNRTFYIKVISKEKPGGLDFEKGKKIKYTGNQVSIRL